MGFNEFGQSLAGIVIFAVVFLVAFGGFQNQSLYSELLPDSISGPNDVNNSLNDVTVSNSGSPYAIPTGQNPNQDSNPFLNLIFNDFGQYFNLFSKIFSASIDALTYIGIPQPIIYAVGVPILLFAGVFLVYFVINVAAGLIGRGQI